MSSKLTSKDLHVITTELLQAKNEWRRIGTALGIQVHDIKGINGTDSQQALTDMLSTVLQRKSLTWGLIINALREPLVSHTELANEIAYKYGEFSTCMMPAGTVLLLYLVFSTI